MGTVENEKFRLGDILIYEGVINPEQLSHALNTQKKTGDLLGETIVKLGFATNDQISFALERQSFIRELERQCAAASRSSALPQGDPPASGWEWFLAGLAVALLAVVLLGRAYQMSTERPQRGENWWKTDQVEAFKAGFR